MSERKVERRLAAILATDVVGYSRLVGEDEEGTLGENRLSPYFPAILCPSNRVRTATKPPGACNRLGGESPP